MIKVDGNSPLLLSDTFINCAFGFLRFSLYFAHNNQKRLRVHFVGYLKFGFSFKENLRFYSQMSAKNLLTMEK